MEASDKYKVKLRHKNNIFTTVMFGYMIDDIHLKGENSSVITNLKKSDLTGVATGSFQNPVEIMYVEGIIETEEHMEVQVSVFLLHPSQIMNKYI